MRNGVADGLQRYKCRTCGKTFNALTGTPLARLRHKGKWLDQAQALADGLTVKRAAEHLNVAPSTAFRWRHRFLAVPRSVKPNTLAGVAEIDETYVLESFKGQKVVTQCVAQEMLAAPATRVAGYRSIINITSANAEIVGPDRADYCMSKAGLSMMSKLFAVRLAEAGVGVFEVRPGIIRTAMTEPAESKYGALISAGGVPMRRWGTPTDVGQTVAALAMGRLPFSTGEIINVGGGLHLHRV